MCSEEETIPINVSNTNTNILCDFSVNINEKDRLIIKNTGQTLNAKDTIDLNITYNGILSNPNLRIKIYKKLNFDSNNQTYELIELRQYIKNNLELIDNYQYYLIKNLEDEQNISLDLKINNFEYGGYKIIFELYDGDSFVKKYIKTFIVK